MEQIIRTPDNTTIVISDNIIMIISSTGERIYEYGDPKRIIAMNFTSSLHYFFTMSEYERTLVKEWLVNVKPETDEEKAFVARVAKAVDTVKYDYKIATIEPSITPSGRLIYEVGKKAAIGISFEEWEKKAKEFCEGAGDVSDIATLEEYDMFIAYRIAANFWSLSYVCNDSSESGNYVDSPNGSGRMDASGSKKVGGFFDGVGNTYKILKSGKKYIACGGNFNTWGCNYPVADITRYDDFIGTYVGYGTGVVVIKAKD